MKKKVYFIAGLGADKRAFSFLDLSFCEPHFIDWVTPVTNETLQSYALRLFASINDEQATIVGLSFGGMLATEIAKAYPSTNVIIVSSCKTFKEIPGYLRFWRRLPVYKYVSNNYYKVSGKVVLHILGAKGEAQRKLQLEILKSSDPYFSRWAIDAIVRWDNLTIPKNIVHIHGTADKLLPFRFVKADYAIKDGEHVLVMDKAEELSALLKELIIK